MLLERWDGSLAVTGVALVIAVGEPRCKFSQVALPDWLTAPRTEKIAGGVSCHSPRRISYAASAFCFLRLDSCREQATKKTPDEEPAEKVHCGPPRLEGIRIHPLSRKAAGTSSSG